MRRALLSLLLLAHGEAALADATLPQGTLVRRPDAQTGSGGPAVLRVDGGPWRVQVAPDEMTARLVQEASGQMGVQVDLLPGPAGKLRDVTIVGSPGTLRIYICGERVALPIIMAPIEDGRLVIEGAETRSQAESWLAHLSGAAPCEPNQ